MNNSLLTLYVNAVFLLYNKSATHEYTCRYSTPNTDCPNNNVTYISIFCPLSLTIRKQLSTKLWKNRNAFSKLVFDIDKSRDRSIEWGHTYTVISTYFFHFHSVSDRIKIIDMLNTKPLMPITCCWKKYELVTPKIIWYFTQFNYCIDSYVYRWNRYSIKIN